MTKKTALLFPGQGSQYAGMGKILCRKYKIADNTFEEANEVLGFDLKNLCFNGNERELSKTENTQPALLTFSVAAFRVLMDKYEIDPCFCAGHSLGEISALTCTGAIKFADALKIVQQRGLFMKEAAGEDSGSMVAILNLTPDIVKETLKEFYLKDKVVISNYNAPGELIISGLKEAVEELGKLLTEKGALVIPLKVSAPFHSPFMKTAALKLKEELKKYSFFKFKWPVISNVDAKPYSDPNSIINKLTVQMVKPVLWIDTIKFLENEGITRVIELGGKNVLKKLVNKNTQKITSYSFNDFENELDRELPYKKNNSIDILKFINHCLLGAVCTKNYNWNNEEYQKGVVEPYNKIKDLVTQIEKENLKPTFEHMQEAIDMLISVFKTKKVPIKEQNMWFNEIFEISGVKEMFKNFKLNKNL